MKSKLPLPLKLVMKNNPKVSIIIPAFNRDGLIPETLDSVISQTYQNWECVVVDDGSTDNTWNVLKSYQNKDNRFRIYKRERQPKGAPTCRNTGFEKSSGDFVIFFDSDDLLAPWMLEKRVTDLAASPDDVDGYFYHGIKFNKYPGDNTTLQNITYNFSDPLNGQLSTSAYISTHTTIFKRDRFPVDKPWSEELTNWQDGHLYINLLSRGMNLKFSGCYIPDFFYRLGNKDKISTQAGQVHSIHNRIDTYKKILSSSLLDSKQEKLFRQNIAFQSLNYELLLSAQKKSFRDIKPESLFPWSQFLKLNKNRYYNLILQNKKILNLFPWLSPILYRLAIRKSPELNHFRESIKNKQIKQSDYQVFLLKLKQHNVQQA